MVWTFFLRADEQSNEGYRHLFPGDGWIFKRRFNPLSNRIGRYLNSLGLIGLCKREGYQLFKGIDIRDSDEGIHLSSLLPFANLIQFESKFTADRSLSIYQFLLEPIENSKAHLRAKNDWENANMLSCPSSLPQGYSPPCL